MQHDWVSLFAPVFPRLIRASASISSPSAFCFHIAWTYPLCWVHHLRDGLLGWSHILPIVNNAISYYLRTYKFCGMQHAFGIYLEVELLNHMVIIRFSLWRYCQTSFQSGLSCFVFDCSVQGSGFTIPLSMLVNCVCPVIATAVGMKGCLILACYNPFSSSCG